MNDIDRIDPWNPTPEEYAAYKEREVQMATKNIAHLQRQGFRPKQTSTLHSQETFTRAMALLTQEGRSATIYY